MDVDAATTTSALSTRGANKSKSIAGIDPRDLPAGRRIRTCPMVPCAGAGRDAIEHWKDCHEVHIKIRASAGMSGDDEGEHRIDYYCAQCMDREWGSEEGIVVTRIRDGKPHIKKRRAEQAFC